MIRPGGLPLILTLLLIPLSLQAGFEFELETGGAFLGSDSHARPGESGDELSLVRDLSPNLSLYFRLRAEWILNPTHSFSLSLAPLRFDASGPLSQDLVFNHESFAANQLLEARSRLDTYRLGYHLTLFDRTRFRLRLGPSLGLRSSKISLRSADRETSFESLTLLPLVNFSCECFLGGGLTLLLSGEAMLTRPARTEDILIGLRYDLGGKFYFRVGYRFNESGVDFEDSKSCSWANHFSLSAGLRI